MQTYGYEQTPARCSKKEIKLRRRRSYSVDIPYFLELFGAPRGFFGTSCHAGDLRQETTGNERPTQQVTLTSHLTSSFLSSSTFFFIDATCAAKGDGGKTKTYLASCHHLLVFVVLQHVQQGKQWRKDMVVGKMCRNGIGGRKKKSM